ncbi:ATP-binding cassette domain-containing protein, partial [Candidatus Falkowbacteria bacterium]|nr:ATP-binding cassette domain-containing protein [Candidatus Falkowbacteria bacterium]
MIEFHNVTKVYPPNHHALREVSFAIKAGEMVSIVGQSGAGKSTIVKLLTGEEKVNRGQIIVGGWDITDLNATQIPVLRRQIGVVYQDYRLLPHKTVYENVAFALEVCGIPHKRITEVVPQVLKIVGLKDMMERFPHQLSGGEKQRVAIARALIHRPKVLLADEPTGNLDTVNTQDIIHLLERINDFGTTIVLVTH